MKLASPDFFHGEIIPPRFTCDGENMNPRLKIDYVPEGAKSLALIVDDPDAPAGTWVHWLLWNIYPDCYMIDERTTPGGAVNGMTSFGRPGYGGPCPPGGPPHNYQFKLYALDILLDLPETTEKAVLENAMIGHILAEAILVGVYERTQDAPN